LNNDDNNNTTQKRTEENNKYNTSYKGFLSTIIQPIFHNSNSNPNLQLSCFLTLPFVFSLKRTISLIDQSIRGYLQFAQTQDEQVLELLPLEKVDEYYFPEEIEEEIIFPSNLSVPVTRKVTSSSSSFSLPLTQRRSEKMPALVSNVDDDDVFRNVKSKVNLHNQQQPSIDSVERTSDNKIVHKKRSVVHNYPAKEEKPAEAFSSKRVTTTPLPKNADQSNIRKSFLSSSSKVQSSRIVSSEGPELFPRNYGETTRQSSSSSSSSSSPPAPPSSTSTNASSGDITSTVKLNESKAATTTTASSESSKSHKLKVIAKDDDDYSRNGNLQSERFTNTTKKMPELSTKTLSSIQPDSKTQIEGIAQTTKKIATPADDKPLNLSDISQSGQDDSIRLPMSRSNTMDTSFASITPSKTKIYGDDDDDDNSRSTIKPHKLTSQTSASDRSHKPTITINKLDVHIVGSSNTNVQRSTLERSAESEDIRSHKLDFEDHQINTEILNKSYLWKYKVRL
jgi:hypothetical protein